MQFRHHFNILNIFLSLGRQVTKHEGNCLSSAPSLWLESQNQSSTKMMQPPNFRAYLTRHKKLHIYMMKLFNSVPYKRAECSQSVEAVFRREWLSLSWREDVIAMGKEESLARHLSPFPAVACVNFSLSTVFLAISFKYSTASITGVKVFIGLKVASKCSDILSGAGRILGLWPNKYLEMTFW